MKASLGVTLHLSIQLAQQPQPTANDAWRAAEAQENVQALTSQFGDRTKTVLVGYVVTYEDRTPAKKWGYTHQRLHGARFGDGARPDFDSHLAL